MADPAFFDDAYVRILEPFHGEAEARRETGALRELLGLALDDRILDLGCGWGRHLALLADAGHSVVGLDLSPALLTRARSAANHAAPLVAGDMRRLPLADAAFDVVINLATSLGLFLDDDTAVQALTEARRVLQPGGRFLLEGMHRADVEAGFAERDAWTLEDGTEVRARRRWDAERGVSHEVLRWDGPEGAGEKRHSLRIRTADETGALLDRAGFSVTDQYGEWSGAPFADDAPLMILLACAV